MKFGTSVWLWIFGRWKLLFEIIWTKVSLSFQNSLEHTKWLSDISVFQIFIWFLLKDIPCYSTFCFTCYYRESTPKWVYFSISFQNVCSACLSLCRSFAASVIFWSCSQSVQCYCCGRSTRTTHSRRFSFGRVTWFAASARRSQAGFDVGHHKYQVLSTSQFQLRPPTPLPRQLRGNCPPCQSHLRGHSRAFDIHVVSSKAWRIVFLNFNNYFNLRSHNFKANSDSVHKLSRFSTGCVWFIPYGIKMPVFD